MQNIITSKGQNSKNNIKINAAFNLKNKSKLLIKDIFIPYTFYNVNQYNNTFEIEEENTTAITIILNQGNYNINELINNIQDELNNNDNLNNSDYVVSFDSQNYKIKIETAGDSFELKRESNNESIIFEGLKMPIDETKEKNKESENIININYNIQYIDLVIPELNYVLNSYIKNNENNKKLIQRLNTTYNNFGDYIYKEYHEKINAFDLKKGYDSAILNELNIQFYDTKGNLIDFNGLDWYINILYY